MTPTERLKAVAPTIDRLLGLPTPLRVGGRTKPVEVQGVKLSFFRDSSGLYFQVDMVPAAETAELYGLLVWYCRQYGLEEAGRRSGCLILGAAAA